MNFYHSEMFDVNCERSFIDGSICVFGTKVNFFNMGYSLFLDGMKCEHSQFTNILQNGCIIIAFVNATDGLFNYNDLGYVNELV